MERNDRPAANNGLLMAMYRAMSEGLGPQHWWPADSAVEVVIGAILTQNTAWTNVEKAIAGLKAKGLLDFERLLSTPESELAEVIRPAGTYRVKARRLRAFAAWFAAQDGDDLESVLGGVLAEIRAELLGICGIGPETADAILLYAGERPSFVVDAYTRRILRRHGLISDGASYDEVKALFEDALPADVPLFNAYHALLVEVGKRYCRTRAVCAGCPLADWPHDSGG